MQTKKLQAWQEALTTLVTDPRELCALLQIPFEQLNYPRNFKFKLKVPRSFINRMQKGNPRDPLLLQVLPINEEFISVQGYVNDPLEEVKANPVPGLLHKYANRILITLTSSCAIHCRYCFRRHFPYEKNNPGTKGWQEIFTYLKNNQQVSEVILSGGDPLILPDEILQAFFDELVQIPSIIRIRIHTRLPVVIPERITEKLCTMLKSLPVRVVFVMHINHPQEIDQQFSGQIKKLHATNILLMNQSVLLKNINDDVDTLILLSEKLFLNNIIPYYLHMLDKVAGAAHFDIDKDTAKSLHKAMKAMLPGYLVPKLAYEKSSAPSKIFFD